MPLKTVLVAFISISSFAVPNQTPPTFLIEQIRVLGARRVSENIIIAESHLIQEKSYSEKELRYAIQKINRLPFILDVQFSLARGSERGKYQLIITVKETALLFFNADTTVTFFDNDQDRFESESASLGLRWYGGKAGVFFIAATPDLTWISDTEKANAYAFGYSNYNLFHRNIFFNITLHYVEDREFIFALDNRVVTSFSAPVAPELNLSIPIKGNHWIKSSWNLNELESETRTTVAGEPFSTDQTNLRSRNFIAFWEYNSTNDNLIPTAGALTRFGYDYTYATATTSLNGMIDQGFKARQFFTNHQKFRELGPHRNYFYGASLSYTRNTRRDNLFDEDTDAYSGAVEAGFAMDLWNRRRTARYGDFRLEIKGGIGRLVESGGESFPDLTLYSVESNVIFRNRLGLIKLSIRFSGSD